MIGDRRGFTLIELITVMVVIGVLSAMAVLRYIDLQNDALAAKVGAEMQQIRVAAISYYADHEDFPPDGSTGVRPPEFDNLLSASVEFTTPAYQLRWLNTGGQPIGVIVETERAGLGAKLRQRLVYGNPFILWGADDVMYVIKMPNIDM